MKGTRESLDAEIELSEYGGVGVVDIPGCGHKREGTGDAKEILDLRLTVELGLITRRKLIETI